MTTTTFAQKDPLNTVEYTLSNGLKLFISPNKTEPKVQTFIAIKAGSKFDPSGTTGLAHYLEHLMFKGTPHLGTNNWEKESALLQQISDLYEKHKAEQDPEKKKAIYRKIDTLSFEASKYAIPNEYDKATTALGAQGTNAYTSNDQTVYVNTIPSNEMEKWLRLESERFQHLTMRLFHTELEAVYEEYNISQDNDGRWAFQNLMKGLFSNHPYGTQSTIGLGEHLKNPSMVNIRNYFNTYYVPNNAAICMSGDVNPEQIHQWAEKYFGAWKGHPIKPFENAALPPINSPVVLENFGPQEEFVYIGWRIPAEKDKESLKARVIDQIMANGTAGLIDIDLVQKQKVLAAYSFPYLLDDYGLYGMYGKPKEGQKLEEVKDLLLAEMDKFKRGDFEDWMIEASINDIELKQTRDFESNRGRAGAYVEAFTHNVAWKDFINQIAVMRTFTKKDLIDFANNYFKDSNYVVSYKRKGDAKNPKVDKPQITPVQMNRDQTSDYLKNLNAMKSADIQPLFVDFQKEIAQENLNESVKFYSVQNKENQLAKFAIIIGNGSDADRNLYILDKYFQYLGTDKLSAEELRKELFKKGLELGTQINRNRMVLSVTGLERNLPDGVNLLYSVLKTCKADNSAFENMKKDILKERENQKINRGELLRALTNYAKYGAKNPSNFVLSNEELGQLKAEDIISKIHGLLDYKHDIFVYASNPTAIKTAVKSTITPTTANLKPTQDGSNTFAPQDNAASKIITYSYPKMVQAQVMMVSKDVPFSADLLPFAFTYNDYYGSGLSSIVFQELREQKALAYSANSTFQRQIYQKDPFFLLAFIGTQADKMPTAVKEFQNLLNHISRVPIQFEGSKESALKQLAADRIVRDNIFWQYLGNTDLGINYDYRKNVYDAVKTTSLDQFGTDFEKLISNRKYTTAILGDSTILKFGDIKEMGEVQTLTSKDLFGF